ncbi:hypothetical protein HUN42_00082 [Streptomyces phage Dagobah]|nr:hypothetical protein HUN42_00082 [Streptomyces phage Dagobah]
MIPVSPSPSTRRRYVRNIISVFESATPDQRAEGYAWYRAANGIASMICEGDVRKGAGLLAALSPQTSWWLNVELASDTAEHGFASGHFRDACSKAHRILAGDDPETVLPMRRKTGQFFLCIVDPQHPTAVCVDRHAHDLMTGRPWGDASRGLDAHGRYAMVADCYRRAGARLGVTPATVQAVTWVAWRERQS